MTESRAAVLHCPYCADEELHPIEHERAAHGAWECRSCLRVFTVKLLGLSTRVPGGA